jgi:hypothetical protein
VSNLRLIGFEDGGGKRRKDKATAAFLLSLNADGTGPNLTAPAVSCFSPRGGIRLDDARQ